MCYHESVHSDERRRNMVHNISDDKPIPDMTDQELIFLWEDMGRNRDPHQLFLLEEEEVEPADDFEKKYVEVYNELKKKNLP